MSSYFVFHIFLIILTTFLQIMLSFEELNTKTKAIRDVYFLSLDTESREGCTLSDEEWILFKSMERFHRLSHFR